ncbi:hypothetical protein U0070_005203 [Myodes glareolus]|uniref:Uncharacterized protein n=1 Tax=Myodes glareolus TaxID=447135 RepID=A0AAW0IGQ4_MYOGA
MAEAMRAADRGQTASVFLSLVAVRRMQGQKGHIGYFNNLKADSRDITYSMTLSTKSNNQNFIVFLNEVQATIIGHESCDLLAVLYELHPDTLPDSRIWLFGFNSYFFQHDSLGMRGTSKRIGLQGCAQVHIRTGNRKCSSDVED